MVLGLAALSAWGVEHFQALTAGLEFPLAGESEAALQFRRDEYFAGVNDAGLSLFHSFFRIAGVLALVAIIPALTMRPDRQE